MGTVCSRGSRPEDFPHDAHFDPSRQQGMFGGLPRGGFPELPRGFQQLQQFPAGDCECTEQQCQAIPKGIRLPWNSLAPMQRKLCLGLSVLSFILVLGLLVWRRLHIVGPGEPKCLPQETPLQKCTDMVPCPQEWTHYDSPGGYFCHDNGGCQMSASGLFPSCLKQCYVGNPAVKCLGGSGSIAWTTAAPPPDGKVGIILGPGPHKLTSPGYYDLTVMKNGRLLGCAAPVGKFPGQPKYGCSGEFATAVTCDAAKNPIKDSAYVAAVHAGCDTALGRGTYGYAYDDGVGLKQCSPHTKYEWILCPHGDETITWQASPGFGADSLKRFRVTNACQMPVWISQASAADAGLPSEPAIAYLAPGSSYTYSIPNLGAPSTRFLPKTGCDSQGNECDIQSMPPCPPGGCDMPIDTKFEASWGCLYATGNDTVNRKKCKLTGQGNPSTFQDWWDGSAVDGWTLPFTVLVDDGNRGLTPGSKGSPDICGPVVCARLEASKLCPRTEYLNPETH